MSKNQVVNTFTANTSWTAPAGVTFVQVFSNPASSSRSVGLSNKSANHSIILTTDGTAYTMGNNGGGELGIGTSGNEVSSPVAVIGGFTYNQVSTGELRCFGVTPAGKGYAWGSQSSGELGVGDSSLARSSPVAIVGGITFSMISGGYSFAVGLDTSGNAWTWGTNTYGQLGDGTTTNRSSPVQVLGGLIFEEVSAGGYHALARTSSGQVYAWGENADGQLGTNDTTDRSSPVAVVGGITFTQIGAGSGNSSSPNSGNSAGLDNAGGIWMWGTNAAGRLGDGTIVSKSSPVAVIGGHSWTYVSNSGLHTLAIDSGGAAWVWGSNQDGAFGTGATPTRSSSPIAVLGGLSWATVTAGSNAGVNTGNSGGVTTGGVLYTWGSNQAGQLGTNQNPSTTTAVSSPVAVVGGLSLIPGAVSFSSVIIPVVPGQSYSIVFGGNYASFGGTTISSVSVSQVYLVYQA